MGSTQGGQFASSYRAVVLTKSGYEVSWSDCEEEEDEKMVSSKLRNQNLKSFSQDAQAREQAPTAQMDAISS